MWDLFWLVVMVFFLLLDVDGGSWIMGWGWGRDMWGWVIFLLKVGWLVMFGGGGDGDLGWEIFMLFLRCMLWEGGKKWDLWVCWGVVGILRIEVVEIFWVLIVFWVRWLYLVGLLFDVDGFCWEVVVFILVVVF